MKKIFIVIILLCAAACAGVQARHREIQDRMDITVTIKVPDSGWRIKILEVYRAGDELAVISKLFRSRGKAAHVITTVSDKVAVDTSILPVTHYIIGKTWKWTSSGQYRHIDSMDDVPEQVKKGECLYRR